MAIGWANDIQQYTLEDAVDWYRRYYSPNNATVVVVGDVNVKQVRQWAEHSLVGFEHVPYLVLNSFNCPSLRYLDKLLCVCQLRCLAIIWATQSLVIKIIFRRHMH